MEVPASSQPTFLPETKKSPVLALAFLR